jgi:hypothetical protein
MILIGAIPRSAARLLRMAKDIYQRISAFLVSFRGGLARSNSVCNHRRHFLDSKFAPCTSPPPFRRKPTPIFHDPAQSYIIYPIEYVFLFLPPFRGDGFLARKVRSSRFRFVLQLLKVSSHSRW